MKLTTLALAAATAIAGVAAPAAADSLYWTITSNDPNVVQLEFYSQRYNRAWPGNGRVYVLDDYNAQYFNLECEYGEQICYGAWVDGNSSIYWGVGINDSYSCSDCCAICGQGDVNPITLWR